MLPSNIINYLAALGLSAVIVLLLTPVFLRLAPRLGFMDMPSERCIHKNPVPLAGGLVVFIAFHSSCYLLYKYLWTDITGLLNTQWWQAFFIASSILLLVGLIDDRFGMRPLIKLAGQAIATLTLYLLSSQSISLLGLNLGFLGSLIFVLLWTLAIINAFNLIDGLDGLCSGLAMISAVGLAAVFIFRGLLGDGLICLALVGACAGFLYYNFFPAKIFLGDTGSMFLGFALASISLHAGSKTSFFVLLATPFFVAGIPIIDTLLAIWRRSIRKQLAQLDGKPAIKIMHPDKEHLHHRLLNYGLKQHHVALVLYAINTLIVGSGLLLIIYQELTLGLFLIIFMVTLYLLIKYVLQIELWETQRLMARVENDYQITRFSLIFYPLFDLLWMATAVWLAKFISSGSSPFYDVNQWLIPLPLWELPVFLLLFYSNSYIKVWRGSFFKDYLFLMAAILIGSSISFALLVFFKPATELLLVNQILLFCLFSLLGIVGVRIPHHFIRELNFTHESHPYMENTRRNILLYGAGTHGGLYLRERYLNYNNELGAMHILGFIDDNLLLRKQFIYGKQVFGDLSELNELIKKYKIDEIILTTAISRKNFAQLKEMINGKAIKLLKWQAYTSLIAIDEYEANIFENES
ncbi:MAG: hypothetical protein WAX77_01310 [Methylococcaceae bacterium]